MPNDMPGKGSATTAPKPHKVSNAGAPLKTLSSPSIILVLALLCLLDSLPNYNLHTTMFVHTHTFFEGIVAPVDTLDAAAPRIRRVSPSGASTAHAVAQPYFYFIACVYCCCCCVWHTCTTGGTTGTIEACFKQTAVQSKTAAAKAAIGKALVSGSHKDSGLEKIVRLVEAAVTPILEAVASELKNKEDEVASLQGKLQSSKRHHAKTKALLVESMSQKDSTYQRFKHSNAHKAPDTLGAVGFNSERTLRRHTQRIHEKLQQEHPGNVVKQSQVVHALHARYASAGQTDETRTALAIVASLKEHSKQTKIRGGR